MGKGLRSRAIGIRFLMFVLGLQAVTPGARDFSSPTLLKLLDSSGAGADSLPPAPDGQDELADEVCLPGGCLARLIVYLCPTPLARPASLLVGASVPLRCGRDRDVISYQATGIACTNLGLSLVRMTC